MNPPAEEHTRLLYGYHVWGNHRIMEHLKQIPQEVFHTRVESIFPSISTALAHIYMTDAIWYKVMTGSTFSQIPEHVSRAEITQDIEKKPLAEIEGMVATLEKKYRLWLDTEAELGETLTTDHPTYGRMEIPFYQMIQHLVNHGAHHRGTMTAMLRQLGFPGISADYFVYYLEQSFFENP